jgi:hypothetical protein
LRTLEGDNPEAEEEKDDLGEMDLPGEEKAHTEDHLSKTSFASDPNPLP